MSLRYGTSSWSSKDWIGPFYPEGTKPADMLAWYATQFDTVEVDATYYRVPDRKLARGWERKTPAGFQLAAKFPRSVVHGGEGPKPDAERVLVWDAVGGEVERFLGAMDELGDKLGPLVLQLPYFNKQAFASQAEFLDRLGPFLDHLPQGYRFGVEVRNERWVDEALLGLLRERGVAFVLVDLLYMPHPADLAKRHDLVTADFVYARLIGDRKGTEEATGGTFERVVVDQSKRLERWAELLRELIPRVPETFAYANNHYAGFGPETIRDLARRLGVEE